MKKILLLINIMIVIILSACNKPSEVIEPNKPNEVIEPKDINKIAYAILTNEESIKNNEYTNSDFSLESLLSVEDCNKVNNIENVDPDKYRKILKFTFDEISDEIYKSNLNIIKNDNRVNKCLSSDKIELDIFNYEALETNINYSKIKNGGVITSGQLKPFLMNSLEAKEEYISYLNEGGKINEPLVIYFNKYEDDFFDWNSLIFIEYILPDTACYIDFTKMYLNGNKLELEFNRYMSTLTIYKTTYRFICIEIPDTLKDVELSVKTNIIS